MLLGNLNPVKNYVFLKSILTEKNLFCKQLSPKGCQDSTISDVNALHKSSALFFQIRDADSVVHRWRLKHTHHTHIHTYTRHNFQGLDM